MRQHLGTPFRVVLASSCAGLVAGAEEAILLQHDGLGGLDSWVAIRFVAGGALLGVPAGALFGLLLCLVLALGAGGSPADMAGHISASLVVAVGVVAPLLVAASFHLFLIVTQRVRDPALAALASASATVVLFLSALALGFAVAALWRSMSRRFAALTSRRLALAIVALAWLTIGLPGFLAGAQQAVRGPFGFVGLCARTP